MRKLNLLFVAGLLAASLLLGIVAHFVHGYQVQRNAKALLDRARKSETESKLAQAAESLRSYLSLRPDDATTWVWYARVMDELYAESPRDRGQVLLVHEEALRHSPDEAKLERKCVDLAMEFGITRLADARRHIETLLANLPKEPRSPAGGELTELLGDCYSRVSNFAKAEATYQEAIRRDPARTSSYFKLALLERNELRKSPAAADEQIARMVARNPGSGLAYLYRFRYDARFRPPATDSDLKRALELAPDDPDVLQTAARDCEARNLSAVARVHLEKGAKLFPTSLYFITGLANLESREQHPERAEAVLRKAYEQKPSWIFALELARLLIEQNKIKGQGQAESFLAVLRSRGLGHSFGRMLEAQILMKEGRYGDAIGEIDAAQAIFNSSFAYSKNT